MRLTINLNVVHDVRKILHGELRRGFYALRVVPVKGGFRLACQQQNRHGKGNNLWCVGANKPFKLQREAIAAGLNMFKRKAVALSSAERAALAVSTVQVLATAA